MLLEDDKLDIEEQVLNEIAMSDDLMDEYAEDTSYSSDYNTQVDVDEFRSHTYYVNAPKESIWDACIDSINEWDADGVLDSTFESATPADTESEEAYRQFVYNVYINAIQMWMSNNPPAARCSTLDDFLEAYCAEYGEREDYL